MRNLLLATCIVLMTSFCTKEAPTATCGDVFDWGSYSIPGFQGNCYLVTNAQIRYMQLNEIMPTGTLAPDNNQCPTKAQIITYFTDIGQFTEYPQFDALPSNGCVAIGFFTFNT